MLRLALLGSAATLTVSLQSTSGNIHAAAALTARVCVEGKASMEQDVRLTTSPSHLVKAIQSFGKTWLLGGLFYKSWLIRKR